MAVKSRGDDSEDYAVEEAIRLRRELLTKGECQLKAGPVIKPKEDTLVRLIHDVAKLRPPKKKAMVSVDGFRLKKTTGTAP